MSERQAWARAIGDEVEAFLRDHERREHDGARCSDETVNFVAYLCHRVGMHLAKTGDDPLHEFRDLVAQAQTYDEQHHHE